MENRIPSYLLSGNIPTVLNGDMKSKRFSFLDKTILNSANTVKSIYIQAESGERKSIIQQIHPIVKVVTLIYMAVVISIVSNPASQLIISASIFLLYILSGLNVFQVYRKIFFLAFFFGFLVVFPASLNTITPGKILFNIFTFNEQYKFWIYHIPDRIGITYEGIQVVLLVFLRVLNSVSFALLIVYTTPFPSFIKSFKIIGVPDTFLMIITLAYKYIFILSGTIEETYLALKSRLSGNVKNSSLRKLISGRIFFIFRKSVLIYEGTYYAMVSRGYNGKIRLHTEHHFIWKDFIALAIIISGGVIIMYF